eukprot:1975173-Rhodomonas_salina.2
MNLLCVTSAAVSSERLPHLPATHAPALMAALLRLAAALTTMSLSPHAVQEELESQPVETTEAAATSVTSVVGAAIGVSIAASVSSTVAASAGAAVGTTAAAGAGGGAAGSALSSGGASNG